MLNNNHDVFKAFMTSYNKADKTVSLFLNCKKEDIVEIKSHIQRAENKMTDKSFKFTSMGNMPSTIIPKLNGYHLADDR